LTSLFLELVAVFDGPATISSKPFVSSAFPPEWPSVLGFAFNDLYNWNSSVFVWNRNNSLVKAFAPESWRAVSGLFANLNDGPNSKFNPLTHRDQLINDQGFLASFIGNIAAKNLSEYWHGLLEADRDVCAAVEGLFGRTGIQEHIFGRESGHAWFAISAEGLRTIVKDYRDTEKIKKLLRGRRMTG
jgi:hypothetical protein